MARIVLITGGGRSGKSRHALRLAETLPAPRLFLATCPPVDDEMRRRIERHRAARDPEFWETLEEPVDLARALRDSAGFRTILVDCLTLWVNNLLWEAEQRGEDLGDEDVARACDEVARAAAALDAAVLFVTNEVGSGIIPENAPTRRFRDLAGRANQRIADAADQVVLMVCGLPLTVKGDPSP
jgi:adenosylcobinamide kinase/adenosylcobinamide-phosphate guanylyltransferase